MAFPNGGVGFRNPVATQQGIVLPWLKSPNFIAGLVGWIIRRDGSAEFNNVVIRGSTSTQGVILMYNGTPAAGNLIISIAPVAGTDQFGNSYPGGITVLEPNLPSYYVKLIAGGVQAQILMNSDSVHMNDGFLQPLSGLPGPTQQSTVVLNSGGPLGHAGAFNSFLELTSASVDGTIRGQISLNPEEFACFTLQSNLFQAGGTQYDPVSGTFITGNVMVDTPWVPLTLNAPYERRPGFHTPAYNVLSSGLIKLRGGLDKTTGAALVTGESPFTLPTGIRPKAFETFTLAAESSAAALNVRFDMPTTGVCSVVFNQTGYTPHFFSLDGVVYSYV